MKGASRKQSSPGLPLISVVIATLNSGRHLEQAIQSVLSQSYGNLELVIIDGGSTDDTLGIIARHDAQIEYWLSEPDEGVYEAWNKALGVARGQWVTFIGADDFYWNEEAIALALPYLDRAMELGTRYVYGQTVQLREDRDHIIEVLGREWELCRRGIKNLMNVPHAGAFHHTSLFRDHGRFDRTFRIAGDYEFLLREFSTGGDALFMSDVCVLGMRDGGLSGSLSNRLLMARENGRARRKNGIASPSIPLLIWILKIRTYMLLEKLFGERASSKLADAYRAIKGKAKRWS